MGAINQAIASIILVMRSKFMRIHIHENCFPQLKKRHPEVKEVGAHLVLLVLALGAGGRSKCVIMFNYESLSESCDSVISSFKNVYFH